MTRHVVLQVTIKVEAKDRASLDQAISEAKHELKFVSNGDIGIGYEYRAIKSSIRKVEAFDPATIDKPERKRK
jgi:hypothetical protein